MAVDERYAEAVNHEVVEYVRLRRIAEAAEADFKLKKREADEQKERLWDFLEAAGVKTLNHEVGKVTRIVRTVATVTDREALINWLEEEGVFDAFTKIDFRQANLNELVKEKIQDGEEIPPGLDSLAIKQITFTAKN